MSNVRSWFTYIVRCSDGTLYTGITNDLKRRIAEHNSPVGGAKYTRPRRPVELVFFEPAESRSAASKKEHLIKKMSQAQKRMIIAESIIQISHDGLR